MIARDIFSHRKKYVRDLKLSGALFYKLKVTMPPTCLPIDEDSMFSE